ncbi:MAG: S4 domain-containing protein [Planctomycetia bacterium]
MPAAADDGLERLQKVLAAAGLGSRRTCEALITDGRVEVDRQVVTQLGTRVDPTRQAIRVDGERLPDPKRVVYMLNKPVGVVTTNYDPDGRPRVVDLVPGPAGRPGLGSRNVVGTRAASTAPMAATASCRSVSISLHASCRH